MSLSEDLEWRGLIKDKTFASNTWLDKPKVFYWGVDCSSDSLTIGNLAPLILARRLAEAGWKAVLLVGGATSLIGDPGGKDEERPLLPRRIVEKNADAIRHQVLALFKSEEFEMVDNYNWLKKTGFLNFLREHGKRFSMTELMQREFVTERIGEGGSGISYAEFSYGLVQGYDFYVLNDKEVEVDGKKVALRVVLQIGGSDQWSNMLVGVSMIRKKTGREAHALSMPLVVNKATGKKFGKSEEGAVWLDGKRTTVFKFYQFWYNTADEDTDEHLKIFTLLNKEQIESLKSEYKKNPSARTAQKKLAYEVTSLVHGQAQADKQQRISEALSGERGVEELDPTEIATIREEMPNKKIQPGASLIEVLVESGLAVSNSEARRLVDSKAVYLNGQKFDKPHLESSEFKNGRLMLRRGKAHKDSALIELA
jgi:tyrosyl-tRNA synthetase